MCIFYLGFLPLANVLSQLSCLVRAISCVIESGQQTIRQFKRYTNASSKGFSIVRENNVNEE